MIGRSSALVAAAILLAGCNPSGPRGSVGSSRACLAENARFGDAWACIKARLASRIGGGDAARDGFIEEGDLLAAQVRAGKVSDAEARRRLEAGLSHEEGI